MIWRKPRNLNFSLKKMEIHSRHKIRYGSGERGCSRACSMEGHTEESAKCDGDDRDGERERERSYRDEK